MVGNAQVIPIFMPSGEDVEVSPRPLISASYHPSPMPSRMSSPVHVSVRELADRMNKVEAKEIHEDAKNWTIVDGKELSAKHNEVKLKEDDVYDKRLKFIKSKSLYKK